MKLTAYFLLCCCAFASGLFAVGCKDEPAALQCGPNRVATSICCLGSDSSGEEECDDVCASKCESDEDCDGEGDRCQDGVCGPMDDCSLGG